MNLNFFTKLDELIGGEPTEVKIETRILNYCAFFSAVVGIVANIVSYLIGLQMVYLPPIIGAILLIIIYYLSRKKQINVNWLFLSNIIVVLGLLYITNLGVFGCYSYYLFSCLIISFSIVRSKNHIYVIISFSALYLFVLLFELYYPEKIIDPYKSIQEKYFDFAFSMFLIIIIISLIINALKRSYEKERRINLEQKAQIEAVSEQKTNFFINLAHETKTPLNLIENYLGRYMETQNKVDLEIVRQNISKLNRDMMNFLDVEKLERGLELYNHDQYTDLSYLIQEKVNLFKIAAEGKSIKVSSTIQENVHIKADSGALERMISNLIDNAIKYSGSDTVILIDLKKVETKAILKITDKGEGIEDEKLQHIFKPFYQISHEKRNIEGVGMGLYIVKNIINTIKGSISVESSIGKGTCFTVQLPISELKKGEKAIREVNNTVEIYKDMQVEDTGYSSSKKTLLIVEDNLDMLSYLKDLMTDYNVFVAINGKHAIEKIQSIPRPDLIISDIMMDQMDGYEFLYEISKDNNFNYLPFIFLTAKTSSEEKILALEKGAIDFISKPFSGEELKSKVKSILESKNRFNESTMRMVIRTLTEKFMDSQQISVSGGQSEVFEFKSKKYKISEREKEVVKLLNQGMKRYEIAEKLFISPNTVTRHLQNIYDKADVNNKTELIRKLFFN